MRILITGGAGFIGSHLVNKFLSEGNEVLVIDNYETAKPDSLVQQTNLKIVEDSIVNNELVKELFNDFKPNCVVHAAASYKDPDNWQHDIKTNVTGTVNVVQASLQNNVERFIYLQTALCYGKPKENPITINHPVNPFTSYSVTKTAGENYVIMSGLSYVSLRLANIYGPKHFSGPMPTFYKRLKAGQKCVIMDTRRDFLEIDDFLDLIDKVLEKKNVSGCFNVSSGEDNSIKEIFDLMVERMQITLDEPVQVNKPNSDDVSTLLLDPSKTEELFGWKAKIPLNVGIDKLLTWYEENGVDEAYTHLKIGKEK